MEDEMDIYLCRDHAGHYRGGVASVVVATDEEEARALLDAELREHGLDPEKPRYRLIRVSMTKPRAYILLDGDR